MISKTFKSRPLIMTVMLIIFCAGLAYWVSIYYSKERTIEVNGIERKYRLHVPKNYAKNSKHELVIALHGFGDSPKTMEAYTGLSTTANKEGFVVVYPYGSTDRRFGPLSWNAQFCCNYALETKVDDLKFIEMLITELRSSYGIEKVYVTGFSNGGMLANLVAAKLSSMIDGVSVIAGSNGGKATEEENYKYIERSLEPVPAVIFHGKQDGSVQFNGGESSDPAVSFASAYDNVNFWLDNNSCEKHPTEIDRNNNYTKEVYANCTSGAPVVFYSINEGRHEWPGWRLSIVRNMLGKSVHANDLMWEFFSYN